MVIEKTINYWREGAERALGVADALMEKEKYPEALFFGHLALEKSLKALYVETRKEHAPYIHSLVDLARHCQLELTQAQQVFLAKAGEFNLRTRYPEDIQAMRKEYSRDFAQEQILQIKNSILWLNSKSGQ